VPCERRFHRRHVLAATGGAVVLPHAALGRQVASPERVASPVSNDLPLVEVALLTGSDPAAINQTGADYDVDGTDLGSSFLYNDQVYLLFGDTFANNKTGWRSNTLAISSDDDPRDGITFDRMIEAFPGYAAELLPAKRIEGEEITIIPTYGIAVGDRLFFHYMSVERWGAPGHWTLGSAGWAWSEDGGEHWTKDEGAVFPGDTNWGQVAIVEHEGFIYLFGIPGGRYGAVRLARVEPALLLDIERYTYWTGSDWVADEADAIDLFEAPVGELSVRWNSYYQRWLMMYLIDNEGLVVLRSAPEVVGPWDEPRIVVRATEYPALYAPYIYPKWNDGPEVWFNLSLFGPYNVWLFQTAVPDLMP
jgi:hypothetical protein